MTKIDTFLESLGNQIYDKDIRKHIVEEYRNHIEDSCAFENNVENILLDLGDPIEIGTEFNIMYSIKISKLKLVLIPILIYVIGFKISYYFDSPTVVLMSVFIYPIYKYLKFKSHPCIGQLNRWGTTFFAVGCIATIWNLTFMTTSHLSYLAIIKISCLPMFFGILLNVILISIDIVKYNRFIKRSV
ncbi:hypothetical protein AN396_04130 [Candidatus Epulonipiscium fishelsonii]|uniref:Uncharacterized protein n=1 Tax=Candidatus Epulonipiscium fishelsonii TaxID=77094 RepID=A0ACC8XDS3_9FIRM|nr:hypothetical protein AN396_04130 [Epulopiscium sp. SCG-B11WGA-EpuloA1]